MKRIAPLLLATLLVSACEKEQVLYTTKSPAVEPVPDFPAMRGMGEAGPRHGDGAGSAVDLSSPDSKAFSAADPGVPTTETKLAGIVVKLPTSFEATKSTSPMRIGQYRVPGADGSNGELVVFHFGKGQGGDARSNVTRWLNQFSNDKGSPVVSFQQTPVNGLSVTRLVASGTWTPSMAPGSGGATGPQKGYAMDALIVEGGPQGSVFFRLTGPEALVNTQSKSIEYLAATVHADGVAPAAAADAGTSGTTTADSHAGHAHAAMGLPHGAAMPEGKGLPAPSSDVMPPGHPKISQADIDAMSQGLPAPAQPDATGAVNVRGVTLTVPPTWKSTTPSSGMRALQMEIPGDGEFVVFHFGKGQGGTAEANIARWVGQVAQPDGSDSIRTAKIEERTIGALKVHTVEVFGTYAAGAMGKPSAPKENYGLVGVTVEGGPEGSIFLRLTGPKATVERERDAMKALVEGLK